MKLSDFRTGLEFCCGEGVWRCTDIGSRVAIAIRIDRLTLEALDTETGTQTERPVFRAESEWRGILNGPPYVVAELVSNEDAMEACEAQAVTPR